MTDSSNSKYNLNLDKIGNLFIYLVDQIRVKYKQDVYLTKLLKLLYIIDEISVIETAAPVTGLEYRVWKMGPVALDVYTDFVHNNSDKFSFYVESKKKSDNYLIQSVNQFQDGEFSDYEIELMDRVIEEFGHLDGASLIELLHEENSIWYSIVKSNNLEEHFSTANTSPFKIDLSQKLGDDYKKALFNNSFKSLSI